MKVSLESVGVELAGGRRALDGIVLEVGEGERLAIVGASGAGKTTLLRVMSTALRPATGRFALAGRDPWAASRAALREMRCSIGTIHQAPPLPPRQRVITAVLAGRLGRSPAWRSLVSLAYPLDRQGARAALQRVELADRLFDRCDRLSGGQLQRVGVARVFYQQAALILADEPVSALDPQLSDRIVGEICRESTERGVTLVASLHAVDLALRWFPRIIGLREGRISFDLPPARVTTDMLAELYASESPVPPTQDNRPLVVPAARPALVAVDKANRCRP